MTFTSQTRQIELTLHRRQLLSLNDITSAMAIECKEGAIWVTCNGEYRDHFLIAGERYVPGNHQSVLIEALNDTCLSIAG